MVSLYSAAHVDSCISQAITRRLVAHVRNLSVTQLCLDIGDSMGEATIAHFRTIARPREFRELPTLCKDHFLLIREPGVRKDGLRRDFMAIERLQSPRLDIEQPHRTCDSC